jgi:chromosome segregation protein
MAKADRAALGGSDDLETMAASARLDAAEAELKTARETLEAAEQARGTAAREESAARDAARKAEDQLGRLNTEARGLAQLLIPEKKTGFRRALDAVSAGRGYEAALAAALGEDLNAALDRQAPAHWAGADAAAPAWPEGVRPLAEAVKAPPELAARLAFTGIVDRADGDRLQARLGPGMRLVSIEGDLWRWDGFVARADAPRPAAVRLAQKTRLEEVEAEIEKLTPQARASAEAQAAAAQAFAAAEEAVRAARRTPLDAEREVARAREDVERLARESARREARAQSLDETISRFEAERGEAQAALERAREEADALPQSSDLEPQLEAARGVAATTREAASRARADLDMERREREGRAQRLEALKRDAGDWSERSGKAQARIGQLEGEREKTAAAQAAAKDAPAALEARRVGLLDEIGAAETRLKAATDAFATADARRSEADRAARASEQRASEARELKAGLTATLEGARLRLQESATAVRETAMREPEELEALVAEHLQSLPKDAQAMEQRLFALERQRESIGAVNLRAEEEASEYAERLKTLREERDDLQGAVAKLRHGIEELNTEGRERLLAAFEVINGHFQALFQSLFEGGQAELRLVESEDPLEAGLEIFACPPGKRLATMSLMSGGEQALTAAALIFGVFLAQPAPVCVLDEVDAPLDDHNVDRFCNLIAEMRTRTETRFICITHNPVTMSRMDRLYGVTMPERGVSQLVSVDLRQAEAMAAE